MRSHPLLHGLLLQIAVSHTPSPALVTLCQFASCTVLVYGCKQTGLLRTDDFEWVKVKYFLIYVLSFSVGTWTNIKVLQDANVETLIVFRSCTPLAVCIFDFFIYRRAMPSARSCAALLLITAGAMAYIACDREYRNKGVRAYFWASVWWAVLVFQLTYGKFLVTGIPLRSLWTPVLYTNSLSILPTLLVGVASGEFTRARLEAIELSPVGGSWLLLSCLVGIGISWSGFWCQSLITATAYTVVGVTNKMLTVTVNVLIWDKHASPYGIASLLLCLIGGSLYQQAPLRDALSEEERVGLRDSSPESSRNRVASKCQSSDYSSYGAAPASDEEDI